MLNMNHNKDINMLNMNRNKDIKMLNMKRNKDIKMLNMNRNKFFRSNAQELTSNTQELTLFLFIIDQKNKLDCRIFYAIAITLSSSSSPKFSQKPQITLRVQEKLEKLQNFRKVYEFCLITIILRCNKTAMGSKKNPILRTLPSKFFNLSPQLKIWIKTSLYCLLCVVLVVDLIPFGPFGQYHLIPFGFKMVSAKALHSSHERFYGRELLAYIGPNPERKARGLGILLVVNGCFLGVEQLCKSDILRPSLFSQYLIRSVWSGLNVWCILEHEILSYLCPDSFEEIAQPVISTLSTPVISRSAGILAGLPALSQWQVVQQHLVQHENRVFNYVANSIKVETLKPDFINHFVEKDSYYRFLKSAQEKVPFDFVSAPVTAVIDTICEHNQIAPCLNQDKSYRLTVFKTLVLNSEKIPNWGVDVAGAFPELKDLIDYYGSINF
jgi:hypothetical protein